MLKSQKKGNCRFELVNNYFFSRILDNTWLGISSFQMPFSTVVCGCLHVASEPALSQILINYRVTFKFLSWLQGPPLLGPTCLISHHPLTWETSKTTHQHCSIFLQPPQTLFLLCLQPVWPVTSLGVTKFYSLQGSEDPCVPWCFIPLPVCTTHLLLNLSQRF